MRTALVFHACDIKGYSAAPLHVSKLIMILSQAIESRRDELGPGPDPEDRGLGLFEKKGVVLLLHAECTWSLTEAAATRSK
jgi:hypothetical protein